MTAGPAPEALPAFADAPVHVRLAEADHWPCIVDSVVAAHAPMPGTVIGQITVGSVLRFWEVLLAGGFCLLVWPSAVHPRLDGPGPVERRQALRVVTGGRPCG